MRTSCNNRQTILSNPRLGASDALGYRRGFTVIESIVAVSVFALTVTSVIGSFIAIIRIDEKSRGIRVVAQNVRFVSEYLTREIRNGYVRYSAYGASVAQPGPVTVLYLNDHTGTPIDITLSGGKLRLTRGGSTTDLTGNDVVVSSFAVWIFPATNPYPVGSVQPRVTFTFTIRSNISIRPTDQTTIQYETSASPRYYGG